MNPFESLLVWLGLRRVQTPNPEMLAVRDALEYGRREKRAENYEAALAHFDQAEQLALPRGDSNSLAVIRLHKADTLVAQGQLEQAEALLQEVLKASEGLEQRIQKSYTLSALGVLAQERDDWASARHYYEQALDVARQANALGAEGRALGHLADIYLQENNASYAVHLLRDALPRLNTSGDIELSSYFVGRLGQALSLNGQEQEGEELLLRALRLAEHMQHRQYERMWNLELGARALQALHYPRAHLHYGKALEFFDGSKPTIEYATALSEMALICLKMGELSTASRYAEQAYTISQQLDDSAMKALAQGTRGVTLRAEGKVAEAIPYLQAADAAYVERDNRQDGRIRMEMLRNLANAYDTIGESASALDTYKRALELAIALELPLEIAHTKRDLGGLYARLNQMQDAIQVWTQALETYEAEGQNAEVARLYCDLGNVRRYLGQGQRAMKDYEHALMTLNAIDDLETRGIVLSNAANAYVDQGDIESADAFFSEAISIAQRLHDKRGEATRRGNHGWFLLTTGRIQRAISALEHALRMSKESGLTLQAAVQTNNLGIAQYELGEYQRALAYHDQALEMLQSQPNTYWLTLFQTSKANTLLAMGQHDEAQALFEAALSQAHQDNNIEGVIHAQVGFGRLALERGDLAEAEQQLGEVVTLARRANMRRLLAEALMLRSRLEAAQGLDDRAEKSWDEAQRLFTILHAPQAKEQPAWLLNRQQMARF